VTGDRHPDWCQDCGSYPIGHHGEHRDGCTVETPPPERITSRQLTKLHTMLHLAGLGDDRGRRMAWLGQCVNRDLRSSAELTKAEAHAAIDALIALCDKPPTNEPGPPNGGWTAARATDATGWWSG
jgi:hypothetical protein